VPLSKIQTDILRLLAAHRDPESYVAGATPLNRNAPRISSDIDVFHDREERVAAAALDDTQTLAAAGYDIAWLRQLPLMYTAEGTPAPCSNGWSTAITGFSQPNRMRRSAMSCIRSTLP
jgi:hypothetical protein